MKYKFSLLSFENDENLAGKTYWYVDNMGLMVGEKVLAPVGVHDKLQEAFVLETMEADPEKAPYQVDLVKAVMCRSGKRTLEIDSVELVEFGGLRYDQKHFTPFGRILYAKEKPSFSAGFRFYGVVLFLPEEEEEPFEVILRSRGGVLLYGERGKKVFQALVHLVRGEKDPLFENASEATLARLKEKLL